MTYPEFPETPSPNGPDADRTDRPDGTRADGSASPYHGGSGASASPYAATGGTGAGTGSQTSGSAGPTTAFPAATGSPYPVPGYPAPVQPGTGQPAPGLPGATQQPGFGASAYGQPVPGQPVAPQPAAPQPAYGGPAHHAETASAPAFGIPAPLGAGSTSPYAAAAPAPAFGTPSGQPAGASAPSDSPAAPRRTPWGAIIATAAATALVVGTGTGFAFSAFTGGTSMTTSPVVQATGGNVDWTTVASSVQNSVVSIVVTSGESGDQGSGVVWDDQGHIVTNNHVVEAAGSGGEINVLVNSTVFQAQLVGTDPTTDLAVIQIVNPPSTLVPIARGSIDDVQVGDESMAVGNPLGLSGSVTTGIISALDRPVTTGGSNSDPVVTNAIQTSAPLNPGNSGGALVNSSGQLIGINSAIASLSQSSTSQSGNIGIGFAIPIDLVENIATQLIKSGSAQHAFLGTSTITGQASGPEGEVLGASVKSVVAGSPAEKAGLTAGDVIIKVGETTITGSDSLVGAVRGLSVGETTSLTVIRNGQVVELSVTLAAAS